MTHDPAREREAGKLYVEGAKAVSTGGHELRMLAGHLIEMVKGTVHYPGALWPIRELQDGKIVELDRFVDYLLRPPRDGLGLPSLHFLKQTLVATPGEGEHALKTVRDELAKEHVDLDKAAREAEVKLHGERAPAPDHGGDRKSEAFKDQGDNITLKDRGTSAAYLAARIKRDHPEIAKRLAAGEFGSVRAAAREAGLDIGPKPLTELRRNWKLASEEERQTFRAEIIDRCAARKA